MFWKKYRAENEGGKCESEYRIYESKNYAFSGKSTGSSEIYLGFDLIEKTTKINFFKENKK